MSSIVARQSAAQAGHGNRTLVAAANVHHADAAVERQGADAFKPSLATDWASAIVVHSAGAIMSVLVSNIAGAASCPHGMTRAALSSHAIHGVSVSGRRAETRITSAGFASARIWLSALSGEKSSRTSSRSVFESRTRSDLRENHRIFCRLVVAFGNGEKRDVRMLAEIEARRTHQIADIFDEQDVDCARDRVRAARRAPYARRDGRSGRS